MCTKIKRKSNYLLIIIELWNPQLKETYLSYKLNDSNGNVLIYTDDENEFHIKMTLLGIDEKKNLVETKLIALDTLTKTYEV